MSVRSILKPLALQKQLFVGFKFPYGSQIAYHTFQRAEGRVRERGKWVRVFAVQIGDSEFKFP